MTRLSDCFQRESVAGRARLFSVLVALGWLLPSLVWILLDKAPLSGDESVYGRASLELFRTLQTTPSEWFARAMNVMVYKPNGMIWIGQFFVPLGRLLGSVDKGLLLSVWLTQLVAVAVLFRAVLVLSNNRTTFAVLASLAFASAPMFVAIGGYYMVESSQALAVCWFILIVARVRQWNPAYTLCHLLGASAFACLTKATTPLFCVWPGLIALWIIACRPEGQDRWKWTTGKVVAMAAVGLSLAALATSWYYRNWDTVLAHARLASSGPAAAAWGKEDTFLNTFVYWLHQLPRSFYYVPAVGLVVALLIAAAIVTRRLNAKDFDVAAVIAALQTVTVVGVFAFSANREARYLFPLLPYVSLALCWSVYRLQSRVLNLVTMLGFGIQLVLVYAVAFGLFSNPLGYPMRALDASGKDRQLLQSIVSRTCADRNGVRYLNVVAIDPNFRGDWLAPEPANYVSERDLGTGTATPPCEYGYLGRGFFGSNVSAAWEALLADRANFLVTIDPDKYKVPANGFNEALKPDNFRAFWASLTTTGLFARENALSVDPGIAVFRRLDRVDHVAVGRALSDQGRHELAVEQLKQATVIEPHNVEAWANLQLAYERQSDFERAVVAGNKALALSPDHYYVNLGLARALMRQRQWLAVLERAEHAAAKAPGTPERASALAVAARAAFELRDSPRGCALLRQAAGVQPDPAILGELKQNCGQ